MWEGLIFSEKKMQVFVGANLARKLAEFVFVGTRKLAEFLSKNLPNLSEFASTRNLARNLAPLKWPIGPTIATAASAGWLAGCVWMAGWLGSWLVRWLGGRMARRLARLAGQWEGSCEEVGVSTTILPCGACERGSHPATIKRMQELTPCLTTRIITCLLCFCRQAKQEKKYGKTTFFFQGRFCW